MEQQDQDRLRLLASQQRLNAEKYARARKEAGDAEADLKILLAPALKELREKRPGIGVEMAILLFIETSALALKLYETWMKQEAIYKGLEKVIDAYASTLITEQSIMKFIGQGEKYG